ncbi:unnamed protein product [Fraxinus pennsylvanica]|uniref:Uncharacterized protein n=1 Tax=Fraxinus pennsylvanica TaxID=56036 RepID=A0AAD2DTW1_9LAMI|nr:unnamed protein product [Fraxinus pennsylvanica]
MILNFLFCVGVSVHVVQNILRISAATRILVAIAEAMKGHIVMKCCSNKTLGFPFTASLRIFPKLWRDPVESLQIIALWLWLEHVGFGKVIRKILASASLFINQTAEEAIMCIKCIKDSQFIHSAEASNIPMTRSIIEKERSLRFFNENRVTDTVK